MVLEKEDGTPFSEYKTIHDVDSFFKVCIDNDQLALRNRRSIKFLVTKVMRPNKEIKLSMYSDGNCAFELNVIPVSIKARRGDTCEIEKGEINLILTQGV